MVDTFTAFLREHPSLIERTTPSTEGCRSFNLRLPPMAPEREFGGASLVLPKGFPDGHAWIQMSSQAVLKVPHVDSDGMLCFSGDAGPASGVSAELRIEDMLHRFSEEFLIPWQNGHLDKDFETESQNYWRIHVARLQPKPAPVSAVYTVDARPADARFVDGVLLLPSKIALIGQTDPLVDKIRRSLGHRAKQIVGLKVIDVPVDFAFSPTTWPTDKKHLDRLLAARLSESQMSAFNSPRNVAKHRIVLLRAPNGSYGYLLPGGPIEEFKTGRRVSGRPNLRLLPLVVSRLDAAWTTGRDTNHSLPKRQFSHVLVIGAGALGSVVVDQLARAGVGNISLVDADLMQAANVGRHLLGVEAIGLAKSESVALHVMRANPSCRITAYSTTAERWLQNRSVTSIDLIVDLSGEPSVRYALEEVRLANAVPLVIGWMEPYVSAAHACILGRDERWLLLDGTDRLEQLQAVAWPDDVLQREPGCGSFFQSYTAVAATHAIGLVAEAVLDVLDGRACKSQVRSWVRSQGFLDRHRDGLELREWAKVSPTIDGVMLHRDLYE